jgi:hypothetical protein
MNETVEQSASPPPAGGARLGLWMLALGLGVLIVLRAGGVGPEPVALGGMVGTSGGYTAMTTRVGTEDLLFLIDDRAEQLMIYQVRGTNAVELVDRQDLKQMFTSAKAAWLGGQPGRARP